MLAGKNLRRHDRIVYTGPIRISWEDEGGPRFAIARCIDLSAEGMRMEVAAPVQTGSRLQIAAERIGLGGSAAVKRIERRGGRFILGVCLSHIVSASRIAEIEAQARP